MTELLGLPAVWLGEGSPAKSGVRFTWRHLLLWWPSFEQREVPQMSVLASRNWTELRNAECMNTHMHTCTSRYAHTFIVRQAEDFSRCLPLTLDHGCFKLFLHNLKGLKVSGGWFSFGFMPSESSEGFVKGGLTLCRAQNAHSTYTALGSADLLKINRPL